MNLLSRFKFKKRPPETSAEPTTFIMVDQVKERAKTALESVPANEQLGVLQHLLIISHSDDDIRDHLMRNKEAADLILYCHYRFHGKPIPAELHYLHRKILEVVQNYGGRILWRKDSGIRDLVRTHLRLNKGDAKMRVIFDAKNNGLLLERLGSIFNIITKREDNYISVQKADFLLYELGLFEQNHCSTNSYLCYDRKDRGAWSKGTKFALTYLSSNIPLDSVRLGLFAKILSGMPEEEGVSTFSKSYKFAVDVEEETLVYGMDILERSTRKLSKATRETLRDRFTERHAVFWKSLKDRAGNLLVDSQASRSPDFLEMDRSFENYPTNDAPSNFLPLD